MSAVEAILAQRRLALVGASRDPAHFSRAVMRALVARGYDVVPVNPRDQTIDGRATWPSVAAIPDPVDAAIIMVPAGAAAAAVQDCVDAGVSRVWLHRGAGQGSSSPDAVRLARQHHLTLVDAECPLMFLGGGIHAFHGVVRRLQGDYPVDGARPQAPRWIRWTLLALQLLVALPALAAGLAMTFDPTGATLGMTTAMLDGPFTTYLVPGLVLAAVHGLGQLGAAWLHARRAPRAPLVAALLGAALVVWIVAQWLWMGPSSALQPTILAVGVAQIALAVAASRARRSNAGPGRAGEDGAPQ